MKYIFTFFGVLLMYNSFGQGKPAGSYMREAAQERNALNERHDREEKEKARQNTPKTTIHSSDSKPTFTPDERKKIDADYKALKEAEAQQKQEADIEEYKKKVASQEEKMMMLRCAFSVAGKNYEALNNIFYTKIKYYSDEKHDYEAVIKCHDTLVQYFEDHQLEVSNIGALDILYPAYEKTGDIANAVKYFRYYEHNMKEYISLYEYVHIGELYYSIYNAGDKNNGYLDTCIRYMYLQGEPSMDRFSIIVNCYIELGKADKMDSILSSNIKYCEKHKKEVYCRDRLGYYYLYRARTRYALNKFRKALSDCEQADLYILYDKELDELRKKIATRK